MYSSAQSQDRLNVNKERGGKTTGNMVLCYTTVIGGSEDGLGQRRTLRVWPGDVSRTMYTENTTNSRTEKTNDRGRCTGSS